MAVSMFILALLSLTGITEVVDQRPFDVGALILIAAQTLSLAWRRRLPVTVLTVVVASFMVERGFNYATGWAVFGIAFALFTIGEQLTVARSLKVGGTTVGVIVAWTAVGVAVYDLPMPMLVTVFGFVTFPLILGREARRREQRTLELEARAIRAEYERERQAVDAVRAERSRIARELHDVIAHEVTVMTIQATAAGRVLSTEPAKARDAIDAVEDAGHRALTEMRRLLGLLRTDAEGELTPMPDLTSLELLVEQMADAGLQVQLTMEGDLSMLPAGVDVNAFRIVQESLTNAVKHAGPGAHVDVVVAIGDEELRIEVTDDGRGAAEALTTDGSGHGLVGMRERLALLDGSLFAGPRRGGGYRILATIPLSRR